MTYRLNDSVSQFFVKDYGEFVKHTPMLVGDYTEPQGIRNNLKDHLIRAYLYEEARRIGILNDETFLLEKKHYRNALVEQHYYTEEFDRNIEIPEQELVDYYNKNQNSFVAERIAWVSFIELTNEQAAYNGISYFQSVLARGATPKLSDTTEVPGLLNVKEPELINEANNSWGEENRKRFIDAKANMLFGPIKHNNRVYLYYISKKGIENVKEFATVRERIHVRLKAARIDKLKIEKTNYLKLQFTEDVDGLKMYCEARKK
jgi:hypothetical protein